MLYPAPEGVLPVDFHVSPWDMKRLRKLLNEYLPEGDIRDAVQEFIDQIIVRTHINIGTINKLRARHEFLWAKGEFQVTRIMEIAYTKYFARLRCVGLEPTHDGQIYPSVGERFIIIHV